MLFQGYPSGNFRQTISDGIKGVFDFGIAAIEGIDWWTIGEKVRDGLAAIDWNGIADGFFELIGAAFGGLSAFFGVLDLIPRDAVQCCV